MLPKFDSAIREKFWFFDGTTVRGNGCIYIFLLQENLPIQRSYSQPTICHCLPSYIVRACLEREANQIWKTELNKKTENCVIPDSAC